MEYKSELALRLENLPELVLTSVHVGIEEKTEDVPDSIGRKHTYLQDKWNITVSYKLKSYSTSYFAGIGNRELIRAVKKEGNRYYNRMLDQFKTELEACRAQWLKLINPNIADVMHCLLIDARCSEGTFEDFCDELGYNSDSIKDLNTYLACQKTRNGMIRMLGRELFEELSQLEH